ncbi:uncharacterized protein LOC100177713 [Ciona intestinalis]
MKSNHAPTFKIQLYRYFINKDVNLRRAYAQLRHLAIVLFICATLSLGTAIADIEFTRQARAIISKKLNCESTYTRGWGRYCPPIDDGTNFSHYLNSSNADSYFKRWYISHLNFAYGISILNACLKSSLSVVTVVSSICLILYHKAELDVLRMKRYIPEDSSFGKSPKLRSFTLKFILASLHIPPMCDAWINYEFQLIVLSRIFVCGIKLLKECNELRYHRLGNVLSNLARVKIHSTFLIKTYFLRYPKFILFVVYIFVVGFFPYLVVITEAIEGNQIYYSDACWLMVVTITNLGSGEVRPRGIPARVVVGLASMIGILSTALWVNVFSKYLDLPNEERRILSIVEHQRCRRIERYTAAACIQTAWRRYVHRKKYPYGLRSSREIERTCKKAMWDWKCVRQNCSEVRRNLESNFSTEDTLIVARRLARRMSEYRTKPIIINKSSLNASHRNKVFNNYPSVSPSLKQNRLSIQPTEERSSSSSDEDIRVTEKTNKKSHHRRDTKHDIEPQTIRNKLHSLVVTLKRIEMDFNRHHSAAVLQLQHFERSLREIKSIIDDTIEK